MFDVAFVGAELMLFDAKVGEFFSTAETLYCVRITALNQLRMCIPPGYPTRIRAEFTVFNLFPLDELLATASAESWKLQRCI